MTNTSDPPYDGQLIFSGMFLPHVSVSSLLDKDLLYTLYRGASTTRPKNASSLYSIHLRQVLVDLPEDMVVEVPGLVELVQPGGVQPRTLGHRPRLVD